MKYWLFTDENPYDRIGMDDWGLYVIEDNIEIDEDGMDVLTVIECLYSSDGEAYKTGFQTDFYEDADEDGKDSRSQRRILSFLLSYGKDF